MNLFEYFVNVTGVGFYSFGGSLLLAILGGYFFSGFLAWNFSHFSCSELKVCWKNRRDYFLH